ncbi:DUF523 domain-containing protein [Rhodovibrionaceae bacterium A322]
MSSDLPKILVSACLMGQPVRYDGGDKRLVADQLDHWKAQGRLLVLCPELLGGFSVPRLPAEIVGQGGGEAVLAGQARVLDSQGQDVTEGYLEGGYETLRQARSAGVAFALLKEGSPSCGSAVIYDGSHAGTRIPGSAVTASILQQAGVPVFSEDCFDDLVQAAEEAERRN